MANKKKLDYDFRYSVSFKQPCLTESGFIGLKLWIHDFRMLNFGPNHVVHENDFFQFCIGKDPRPLKFNAYKDRKGLIVLTPNQNKKYVYSRFVEVEYPTLFKLEDVSKTIDEFLEEMGGTKKEAKKQKKIKYRKLRKYSEIF